MPINLIDYTGVEEGQTGKSLGGICQGKWEMSKQICALEGWLNEIWKNFPKVRMVQTLVFLQGQEPLVVEQFLPQRQ